MFQRKKVVEAFLVSSRVFWEKMGFPQDKKTGDNLTFILIPAIGAMFLLGGLTALVQVIGRLFMS